MTDAPLFEYHGGLHLRDSVLWLDTPTPRQLCFISHANQPGAAGHQKILATERTVELLRAIGTAHGRGRRAHEPQALVSPYGRPFALGQLSLELFPSGFVAGSASLLIKQHEVTIVYAGHFNPRRSSLAERLEARPCDVLVLPCPFGQRRYVFPPRDQVLDSLVDFVSDTLARGASPLLFCSPLGEAQLVVQRLQAADLRCRVHRNLLPTCSVYRSAGLLTAEVRRFSGRMRPGEVLIWPIGLHRSAALRGLTSVRTALVSGLALDMEPRQRMGCDAAFVLSAYADYPAHLEYVRACEPRQVILTQGPCQQLREDLEGLGVQVSSIGPALLMTLF